MHTNPLSYGAPIKGKTYLSNAISIIFGGKPGLFKVVKSVLRTPLN